MASSPTTSSENRSAGWRSSTPSARVQASPSRARSPERRARPRWRTPAGSRGAPASPRHLVQRGLGHGPAAAAHRHPAQAQPVVVPQRGAADVVVAGPGQQVLGRPARRAPAPRWRRPRGDVGRTRVVWADLSSSPPPAATSGGVPWPIAVTRRRTSRSASISSPAALAAVAVRGPGGPGRQRPPVATPPMAASSGHAVVLVSAGVAASSAKPGRPPPEPARPGSRAATTASASPAVLRPGRPPRRRPAAVRPRRRHPARQLRLAGPAMAPAGGAGGERGQYQPAAAPGLRPGWHRRPPRSRGHRRPLGPGGRQVLAGAGGGGAPLGQRRGQAGVEAAAGHRRHLGHRRRHDRHGVAVRGHQARRRAGAHRFGQAIGRQVGRRPQQLVVEVGAGGQRAEHRARRRQQLVHLGPQRGHQ